MVKAKNNHSLGQFTPTLGYVFSEVRVFEVLL